MSAVVSFRLNDENPREAQAREVLNTWVNKGFSVRHVLTEALLALERHEGSTTQAGDLTEVIERFAKLVDKLEKDHDSVQISQKAEPELRASFISSIKTAARPGLRLENG